MAARPEVVQYLRQHLKAHPPDALKSQLAQEGVSENEFTEALAVAKRPRRFTANPLAMGLAGAGLGVLLMGGYMISSQKPPEPAPEAGPSPEASTGESAFVGRHGYVVRLPEGYVAVQSFRDHKELQERVHFHKSGADPTSLLDEGLYGPMGIIRLDVAPSELAGYTNGLEVLTRVVTNRARQRDEKFSVKNFQVASLHGVQFTYEIPFARVEAYVLGRRVLYTFYAGHEDAVYLDILNSLRETGAEG